ncbi:MAG: hypothetical protein FJ395_06330 [Verrucomicrobia bacterium]|nr:hypothetical protein [Verrucomicrobiota bacterium]
MKNNKPQQKQDDFIAPAKRAFRRVARQIRAEHAKLGLPLVVGENGHVRFLDVSPGDDTKERATILKGVTLKKLRAELLPTKK